MRTRTFALLACALAAGSAVLDIVGAAPFWAVGLAVALIVLVARFAIVREETDRLVSALSFAEKAEAAVYESEERFRIMADSAPVLMWMSGPDGEAQFFNRGWLEFVGRTLEAELRETFLGIHPKDLDRVRAAYETAIADRVGYELDYRLRRADGEYRWILDRAVPRFLPDGTFAGLTGVAVDITDRRLMEGELRATGETLTALVEASPLPIVAFDTIGHVTRWNRAAEHVFGWSATEAVGRFNPLADAETQAEFLAYLEDRLRGRTIRDFEAVRRRKDGSQIEVAISSAPLHDAAGDPVGMVSLFADVTKRNAAEERLREAEERYRMLVEQLPLVTYIDALNEASSAIYMSPQAETIFGYAVTEWTSDPDFLEKVLHPDDRVRVMAEIRRTVGGQPFRAEYRVVAKNGRVVWVHDEDTVICDAQGRPVYSQGFMLDITERKLAEERARGAEEARQAAVAEALAASAALERAAKVHLYSTEILPDGSKAGVFVGPNRDRLLGGPVPAGMDPALAWDSLIHPDDLQLAAAHKARNMRGEPSSVEYRLVGYDGITRWISAVTKPHDVEGRTIYDGVVWDITERKVGEERLREAEERYRSLVEQLPAVVYASGIGTDGQWIYVSPQIESILGFTDEEWRSHGSPWVTHLHDDDRDRVLAEEDAAVAHGQPVSSEYRFVRPDGRVVWLHDQASLVVDDHGVPLYLHGFMLDITKRKEAEEALRRTEDELERLLSAERLARADAEVARVEVEEQNERLRELDRLKDEFVALVSHELRTPLTSIRGYLELVLEKDAGDLTDDQERFLGVVDRNAERLQRLVGDLLFVAQVEAGRLSLQLADVDLGSLARESIEAAGPAADEKSIRLDFSTSAVPRVRADRARLGQLLDNLVSNAIKFTPEGGSVEVRVVRRNGCAALQVVDTGMGISEEEQKHLFQRFFRTAGATRNAIQGTGLGLAIAKAIAEGHGGSVEVESAEGAGTTFTVQLPLVAAGEAEMQPEEATP